jgi:ribosomal peptide maturation radical SAM protein 1
LQNKTKKNTLMDDIRTIAPGGDLLFIVPPFGSITDTALGVHILSAIAVEAGYKADILYLNMMTASVVGLDCYDEIYSCPLHWMLGERLAARSAYGLPPLGRNPESCGNDALATWGDPNRPTRYCNTPQHFDMQRFVKVEAVFTEFLADTVDTIASLNYRFYGFTVLQEQVNCCIALIDGIKKIKPGAVTLVGGGSCDGPLAKGMLSLSPHIDYIFSGESEHSFRDFLQRDSNSGLPPRRRIIVGEPPEDLDIVPPVDYRPFVRQLERFAGKNVADSGKLWYETSRGCWWIKHKCNYCSINQLQYRKKSPGKALRELKRIHADFPGRTVYMSDSVLPKSYINDFLPLMTGDDSVPPFGYQVRTHMGLGDLTALKKAGLKTMLPGIESLSSHMLQLMSKGATPKQNLLFLRNAMSTGIPCDWLLLYGFPGDTPEDYEEMRRIIPLLQHLQSPRNFHNVLLMRFAPYTENPRQYGITDKQPWAATRNVYPDNADIENLAIFYAGDFQCAAQENMDIIRDINRMVMDWKNKWKSRTLAMAQMMGAFFIYDNRDIHTEVKKHVLDYSQALEVCTPQVYDGSNIQQWAIDEKLGIVSDSWYVPLVTAAPELLLEFETQKCREAKN